MSTTRQSELFASKDWTVIYKAFTQINFNASDPTSINQAMRDYLAMNYPEDFNDWIESSEFVAIIDLLAWLTGNLAFKMDINARENFLETAEARESILRLARFLSYNPRRNRPATGMVKIMEVSTDDDIQDSTGANLAGVNVLWNNVDDPDWFERFTTILSNAFVQSAQFGQPLKAQTIADTRTQLYRVNCLMGEQTLGFTSAVGGESMAFELVNADFDDDGLFIERSPDNDAAFNLFYRNDGAGNASARTGFFMLFKQGSTLRQNFRIDYPVENQLLDLEVSGVNETDVWVQTVGDNSDVLIDWKKVPAIFSENITYNNINPDERYIFSVLTRDQDRASIRFADGVFGAAPIGNIQVVHRVSNGKQYAIRPADINRITQIIPYYNRAGVKRNLRIVFSLQETVTNSTPRETDEQIRSRAPGTFAAQNRMVTGEDYNTFPLSSNVAVKLRAVNRIYAGHSRFVDLNDPTSTYTDAVVTADDGMIYHEPANIYAEVPLSLNRAPEELVGSNVQAMLRNLNVTSFVRDEILRRIATEAVVPEIELRANTFWVRATSARYSSSGSFTLDNNYFRVGTSLKFLMPNGVTKWVNIAALNGLPRTEVPSPYARGPVTLSENMPDGSRVVGIIPNYDAELADDVFVNLIDRFDNALDRRGFSLWFDPEESRWVVRDEIVSVSVPQNPADFIHVMTVEFFAQSLWRMSARGIKHVFESARKVKWYVGGDRVVDAETGLKRYDSITVLSSNADVSKANGVGLGYDRSFAVSKLYYYGDGSQEPRRVQIDFVDQDSDGAPDEPESFVSLIDLPVHQSTLFWQMGDAFGSSSFKPIYNVNVFLQSSAGDTDLPAAIRIHNGQPIPFKNGDIAYMAATDRFYIRASGAWVLQPRRSFKIARGRGGNTAMRWMPLSPVQNDYNHDGMPDDGGERFVVCYSKSDTEVAAQGLDPAIYLIRDGALSFKWKHYSPANHRIDPSITNIIDMFMLTNEYDYLTRLWIANGAKIDEVPAPPTELDLRLIMSEYASYKMVSDETVWRPVTYKFLFGNGSEDHNMRARFKIVKLPGSTLADGEIKSRVVSSINDFFDVSRWDFGETFYFTELAAFVHQQLAGMIGSFVIVPMDADASFGDNFEVRCRSDEIFLSTATVNDIDIISSNTSTNLRIR